MKNQNKTIDQIYDLFAVRIIVDNVKDCYAALGVIHEIYKPIPGRFKDYIAMPKANMYQSLHTTLIGSKGVPFEIQIRTYEMHKTAEYGIAAHWKYKEMSDGRKPELQEEEKLNWFKQILEWQRDMSDNKEFLSLLKSDLALYSDVVYCFTPSGDVKNLPMGSTPIDFAYSVHSAVGNKMIGARVNGKLVTIDYEIKNGDCVEIITSQNSKGPSRDWLNVVKSTQAKNKINQWFKNEFKEENITHGKDLMAQYCKTRTLPANDILKQENRDYVVAKYGFHDWDSLMAAVGHGALREGQVINKILEHMDAQRKQQMTDEDVMNGISEHLENVKMVPKSGHKSGAIVVKGLNDIAVRFVKCCNPLPGDEIVGFVTRGRGVSIHRTDCVNIVHLPEIERARLIEAEWDANLTTSKGEKYMVDIAIYANKRAGLISDISKVFTEREMEIYSMNVNTSKHGVSTIMMTFEVENREELNKIVEKIKQIKDIVDVDRQAKG
jgi:GTP pyrophosphokinase